MRNTTKAYFALSLLAALAACGITRSSAQKPELSGNAQQTQPVLVLEEHRLHETVQEFLEREHWPTSKEDCQKEGSAIPEIFRDSNLWPLKYYCDKFKRAASGEFMFVGFSATGSSLNSASFKDGKLVCLFSSYAKRSYAEAKAKFTKSIGEPNKTYPESNGAEMVAWFVMGPNGKVQGGVLDLHSSKDHGDAMARLYDIPMKDSCAGNK